MEPNLTNGFGWIANFIWGIADDVLRDVYVRGKYRDVILPMNVAGSAGENTLRESLFIVSYPMSYLLYLSCS